MIDFTIPLTDYLEVSEEGYQHVVCVLCNTQNLRVQIVTGRQINLYCPDDSFCLFRLDQPDMIARVGVYAYPQVDLAIKMIERLNILLDKGVISLQEFNKADTYARSKCELFL